ncbi:uncharacterized protein LOC117225615 [Megalopta genalis]|uniref:uncharacterized protein LOC117225615 n=1 Tax=Megalopta genalis TaxID=115081 RepID=UPI003FD125D3
MGSPIAGVFGVPAVGFQSEVKPVSVHSAQLITSDQWYRMENRRGMENPNSDSALHRCHLDWSSFTADGVLKWTTLWVLIVPCSKILASL